MLDLSPTKLIIIFVVAIVLLGPKRLPQVARQLGAAWAKVRTFSQRVDSELRQTMPDLPTGRDIVRYARSPITLLNELADGAPTSTTLVEDRGAPGEPASKAPGARSAAPSRNPEGRGIAEGCPFPRGRVDEREEGAHVDLAHLAVDDPTLN